MDNNKERYKEICEEYHEVPLFFQPWWLDRVTVRGGWNVVIIEDEKNCEIGVLPFLMTRKLGLRISVMPPLTPYLGPFVINQVGESQELISKLYDELKGLDYYAQRWLPDMYLHTKALPEDYQETIRYTYQFRTWLKDEINNQLYPDVKNKIRKANEAFNVREEILDLDPILDFYEKFCFKKNIKLPLEMPHLQKLIEDCLSRNQGKLYVIEHLLDQKIAGFQLTVSDTKYAYNLLLAIDSTYQSDGIAQKLLWRSINDHIDSELFYDFEGSMIPGVSKMFNHFGGSHTPYSKIYCDRNKFVRIVRTLSGVGS